MDCIDSFARKLPFRPPSLPYSYSALNKISDTNGIESHFKNFHMRGFEDLMEYIATLNAENTSLCQFFKNADEYDSKIIEAACIVYNHQLFWDNLSPYCGELSYELDAAINRTFGSTFKLKEKFIETGMKSGFSGWLWLIVNNKNHLQLITTTNNENPVLKHALVKGSPILTIDLWEHAYAQKFSNDKEAYLKSVWSIINWCEVSQRYRFSI
ncbi:MAG: superoxide dismutase [Prolixibacteraceae bacterium]